MYKKIIALAMAVALLILAGCAKESAGGNYTDEMKIPYGRDLSEPDGPDSVERKGDHKDSPYFSRLDFYNMKPDDTLFILPQFKTIQQTSELSCGIACILMVLEHYGMSEGIDEWSIAEAHPRGLDFPSTSLSEAISIFNEIGGFRLTTTRDYGERIYEEFTLETIRGYIEEGIPVMVCWNDWGGHWQVIIGYDTMGTEMEQDDVLIVADPYDTTDHNQDGYGVYPAQRFYYNFTTYNFFDEEEGNDMLFIAAEPA